MSGIQLDRKAAYEQIVELARITYHSNGMEDKMPFDKWLDAFMYVIFDAYRADSTLSFHNKKGEGEKKG